MIHRLIPALFGLLALVALTLALACQSTSQPDSAGTTNDAPDDDSEPMTRPDPTVIPAEDAEVRVAGSGKASVTILARGLNAFVGRLEMDAGAAVPVHRDATEEYIHILEGSGVITIDGTEYDVAPGTTIYMPADAEVTFQNGDEKLVALQVFAGPAPARKYDSWKKSGE